MHQRVPSVTSRCALHSTQCVLHTLDFFARRSSHQLRLRLTLKDIAQLYENVYQKTVIVIFPKCIILQPVSDCLPRQIFGFILRGIANLRALCWFVKVKVEWASIKLSTTHSADITPVKVRRTFSRCQQCWSWIVYQYLSERGKKQKHCLVSKIFSQDSFNGSSTFSSSSTVN